MRKYLTATFFLFLGIFAVPQTKAAIYTHTLNYTRIDGSSETLTGRITFDDTQVPANTVNSSFNSSFITDITITYTNDVGTQFVANYSDFTDGGGFDNYSFVAKSGVTVDFGPNSSDTLFEQLDNLQIGTTGGDLSIGINPSPFQVQAQDPGDFTDVTDFRLTGTVYHSPAPLPILALLPAFSSITKLKRRYNLSKK